MSVEIDPQELGFRRMFPYPMSQEAVKREKGRAGLAKFCVARSLHRRSLADPTDQEPQHHACSFQGTRPSSGDVNEGGVPRLTGGQVKTTAPKQYVNSSLQGGHRVDSRSTGIASGPTLVVSNPVAMSKSLV